MFKQEFNNGYANRIVFQTTNKFIQNDIYKFNENDILDLKYQIKNNLLSYFKVADLEIEFNVVMNEGYLYQLNILTHNLITENDLYSIYNLFGKAAINDTKKIKAVFEYEYNSDKSIKILRMKPIMLTKKYLKKHGNRSIQEEFERILFCKESSEFIYSEFISKLNLIKRKKDNFRKEDNIVLMIDKNGYMENIIYTPKIKIFANEIFEFKDDIIYMLYSLNELNLLDTMINN